MDSPETGPIDSARLMEAGEISISSAEARFPMSPKSPYGRSKFTKYISVDDDHFEGLDKDSESKSRTSDVSCLARHVEIFRWLPKYDWREHLQKDLVAGLTVGVIAIPQSISYASVAGLPPQYGMYCALMGSLPYFIFGTSPHLIGGPTAVMSLLVYSLIPDKAGDLDTGGLVCSVDPTSVNCYTRIALAATLSFLAGSMQVLMGLFNLGSLVELVSEPIIAGFTSGSAFLIASTQFTSMLSFASCKDSDPCHLNLQLVDNVYNIIDQFANINNKQAKATGWTFLYGCISMFMLWVIKEKLGKFLPSKLQFVTNMGPLLVMVVSIWLMYATGGDPKKKENDWHIKIVGPVCPGEMSSRAIHPECLPALYWPTTLPHANVLEWETIKGMFGTAVSVALVGYMEAMTIAKTMWVKTARKGVNAMDRKSIDPSKELIALGTCNLFSGFFQGYPVTGSFSRTAVNGDSGARSPVSSTVSALAVGAGLVFLTPVLQYCPKVALAAIVLIAVVKLVHVDEAIMLWRVSKSDFLCFMAVFTTSLIFGVEASLILGVLLSWVLFFYRKTTSSVCVLGKINDDDAVSDVILHHMDRNGKEYDDDDRIRDVVVIIRENGDLSFSNASNFDRVVESVVETCNPVAIIVDCDGIHSIDSTGIHVLKQISEGLMRKGILFYLAHAPLLLRQKLELTCRFDQDVQKATNTWDCAWHAAADGVRETKASLRTFMDTHVALMAVWQEIKMKARDFQSRSVELKGMRRKLKKNSRISCVVANPEVGLHHNSPSSGQGAIQ